MYTLLTWGKARGQLKQKKRSLFRVTETNTPQNESLLHPKLKRELNYTPNSLVSLAHSPSLTHAHTLSIYHVCSLSLSRALSLSLSRMLSLPLMCALSSTSGSVTYALSPSHV